MFIRMHKRNSDFFHLIHMDNEGRLDSVFWVYSQKDAICDYCWSQLSWPIHIVWFKTPISRGQRDIYLSMRNTIKEVTPTTIWQYCIWYIMCKLLDKFKGLMEQFCETKKELRSLVYDSLMKSMFENNWNQFVAKYGLETNQWFIKLYSEREH
ncbi:hypothetical protein M9H77_36045 [Catharanthus roseus]|uniref:Uncharacterized protein n=1 Tax=Catharanthus roseus TaxID=4058 RepID=A0ACB9ZRJ2_CATRO|nr:hypothetical protein M9H77_36045 [Catharanthus roseus]